MRTSIILTLAILAAAFIYVAMNPPVPGAPESTETSQGEALIGGDFNLTDTAGNTVTDASLKGQPRLVFFGFTHCPMICPAGLANLSAALAQLGENAPRGVFITVDPERDTPAQMADYLQNFPGILGLTGTREQVDKAIAAYRVYAQKVALEADAPGGTQAPQSKNNNYDMNHSGYIYFMDSQGKYLTHFAHDTAPEELAQGVREALR